jgi:excinuclease ABC subunit C
MKNDRLISDLSESGADLYPHMKITTEEFPRVLASRRDEQDGAEYYGAFLTKTSVRILIDFLNRKFRLRTCDIPIDGTFPVPCTQYYSKRCLGPCVASLCSPDEYLSAVSLVRGFLANDRRGLTKAIEQQIDQLAEDLDFEAAAEWRDLLLSLEKWWANPRLNIWLDDAVDTYETDETAAGSFIYLVTQRGRHVLGRKIFSLPRGGGMPAHESIAPLLLSFYRFHMPREIRVSFDFEERAKVARELTERFGRPAKITVVRPDRQRITSVRALREARSEGEWDYVAARATPRQIQGELKRLFGLSALPERVECFDVAHISGKGFAAASAVWNEGRFASELYSFRISDETTELAALAEAVKVRLSDGTSPPDLVLMDGGLSQLNAVLRTVEEQVPLVGVVKPRGQHSSVSHFITSDKKTLPYEPDNPAQNMLRLLRDDAHDLANRVHRELRDMGHHYELAALLPSLNEADRRKIIAAAGSLRKLNEIEPAALVKLIGEDKATLVVADLNKIRSGETEAALPVIVPIRYTAENGDADDLIPIRSE